MPGLRNEPPMNDSARDAVLEISGLRFRYADHDEAQGDWTVRVDRLTVDRGEQVLLTAGSGRGKSTLLYLIAGLMDPAEGEVKVDGVNIHALRGAARDHHRGRAIGMIFQTFNLLHGFTAIENVMAAMMFSTIPAKEHTARAAALLGRLGIERIEADADRLSVGQQQRVAVARAVACGPGLVLADEPTASLDPENAATAIKVIQDACRGIGAALVCVSHDPSMRDRFEKRLSLDELG